MKCVIFETTNRIYGCLEQGGVCGRRFSYPVSVVVEAMGEEYNLEELNPEDMVPGTGVCLRDYLEFHYGSEEVCLFSGTPIR